MYSTQHNPIFSRQLDYFRLFVFSEQLNKHIFNEFFDIFLFLTNFVTNFVTYNLLTIASFRIGVPSILLVNHARVFARKAFLIQPFEIKLCLLRLQSCDWLKYEKFSGR